MPGVTRGPRSIAALMAGLARLGLSAFGGVGPQAYHFFVEHSGWLSPADFAECASVAQALPGANVVNMCAILGDRWFGPLGALGAVAAITVPPLALVVAAASLLARVPSAPRFTALECTVVAASAGLILATAYRIFRTIARRRWAAGIIALGIAVAVGASGVGMPVATVVGIAVGLGLDLLGRPAP